MPVDWTREEVILACALLRENDWKALRAHHTQVIELSRLLNQAPIHRVEVRDAAFRNPNGVQRKLFDLATRLPGYTGKPTKGGRTDREVLADYLTDPDRMDQIADTIRTAIRTGAVTSVPDEEIDGEEIAALEGRLLVAVHLKRERDPRLRRRKLAHVKSIGQPIACEVCGFDFAATYGERGKDYIEVHHVVPLHISGEVQTRLRDLALLCSNCHRMVHRAAPWITPEALRSLL